MAPVPMAVLATGTGASVLLLLPPLKLQAVPKQLLGRNVRGLNGRHCLQMLRTGCGETPGVISWLR